jgi:predicted acyltransferase
MTIAFMIIVNTPGSWKYVYSPLKHAEWHGCTPTDLVFPFFLFIVGCRLFYSLKKFGNEINTRSIFRILRRMPLSCCRTIPYHLPIFCKRLFDSENYGVLQRIALAMVSVHYLPYRKEEYLWIVTAVLLLLYWAVLVFFMDLIRIA